jgi:hypothetical protein
MSESGKWYVEGVWSNGFLPHRGWGAPEKHSIPDPPPPLKEERSGGGGVWNSISTMDLGADTSAVQMCTFVIPDSRPPPTVKGRTVGGGGGGGSGKAYQP